MLAKDCLFHRSSYSGEISPCKKQLSSCSLDAFFLVSEPALYLVQQHRCGQGMAKTVEIIGNALEATAAVYGPAEAGAAEQLVITDDLPACPQITASEIDVVERFFGDILDAVLRDAPPLPTGSSYKHLSG